MTNREELESEDNWDFQAGEVRPPVRGRRVVISVSVRPEEFAKIARSARRAGMKVSEFMRQSAVEKSRVEPGEFVLTGASVSGVGTIVIDMKPSDITRSSNPADATVLYR
jgi:hypothetical protein